MREAAIEASSALVSDKDASDNPLRAKLRSEVLPASWPELLYQFARGGLFLVASEVDLLDVAEAMANDDRPRIEQLLQTGALRRASDDDARVFQATPGVRLQFVIVQPWVVAQVLAG
ncbi:MAG: hypothetical protein JWN48_5953 [Myxococcaceae bacterium]|nr:hypothetical protein [Myxococcaceae bacterium]